MSQYWINMLFVGASFLLYIGIAVWARAGSTKEFYVAGGGVHPVTNGMATAKFRIAPTAPKACGEMPIHH